MLLNLGSNAVKFTEQGEVHITGRVREHSESGVLLYFSVRDTGIGLSDEQQAKLFSSFQQADTSTSRRFGGTGLGLAIAKRLVELMGGEIGVSSEPGQGSNFWFTLRAGIGKAQPRVLLPRPELRGTRVLVVDDNATARLILKEMLASMTFAVDDVASGPAAVAATREAEVAGKHYAVIFLDWHMAGMDGLETARQIQALGLVPAPHLAMVTAFGREDLMQAAGAAGIETFLIKPVSPSLLFDSVMELLGGERLEARPSATTLAALAGARILLVEDNELNQEVASELLTQAGFVVDVADNGAVGLRMVQAASYELVFMDMQMPAMDGLEATREIRKLPQFAALPIVAMTANAMQQDRERCLAAGMNDFIAKPIDPEALWAVLRRWLTPRTAPALTQPVAAAPAPAASGAHLRDSLAAIPGLDIVAGLKTSNGKLDLYVRLLRKFVAKDEFALLHGHLASGDLAGARLVTHTIKGVAATPGAEPLRASAASLEDDLIAALDGGAPAENFAARARALEAQYGGLRTALLAVLPA